MTNKAEIMADQEVLIRAEQAGGLAQAAAEKAGLDETRIKEVQATAIAQTVALEVAKPKVMVDGGHLKSIGKIDDNVRVTGKALRF